MSSPRKKNKSARRTDEKRKFALRRSKKSNKSKKSRSRRAAALDCAAFLAGCAIYSVAFHVFIAPNEISPGGLTGLSAILNHLFGLPTGMTLLALNLPLLGLGIRKFGLRFFTKTIAATVMLSVLLDAGGAFLPAYRGNCLMSAVYGGVLSGLGLSLVFLRGGTTGGTDIIAKLVNLRFPFLSMGRVILLLDAAVTLCAAAAYRDLETGLYTAFTIFASTRTIDGVLYGADRGKLALIVCARPEELSAGILKQLGRGVTVLRGRGAYTGDEKDVLLCAVRRHEAARLHALVRQIDPGAFLVMSEAGEIVGEGFKQM